MSRHPGAAPRSQTFLGDQTAKVPFIIGMAGSVAVGKSTTARVLQALLARWPGTAVDLVTTDGFLFPNAVLKPRHHAPQGLSRELRPGAAGAVPGRREVGRARARRRSTRTALRHRARRDPGRAPARHRDRRGAERAAGAAAAPNRRCSSPTSSTSRSTSTPTRPTSSAGTSSDSCGCATPFPGPGVVLPPLRLADRSRGARPPRPSGPRSTA